MIQNILRTIICYEFENNVGGMQWKKHIDGETMHCMEMTFNLNEIDYKKPSLYPKVQLLIFGASNYIAVYYRESKTREEFQPWEHLSRHDSCWRDDGVGRFLSHFEDRMSTLGWHDGIGSNTWYRKRVMGEEEAVELREITRNKFKNA